jgi:large subunit ribosomal protein L21
MYAVISDRGKQYTVREGERLRIDLLEAAPGAALVFDRVLLVGHADPQGGDVRVGAPTVDGVSVKATVLGAVQARKIVVFKKKRRKKYRRKQGHRQRYTDVRVESIEG